LTQSSCWWQRRCYTWRRVPGDIIVHYSSIFRLFNGIVSTAVFEWISDLGFWSWWALILLSSEMWCSVDWDRYQRFGESCCLRFHGVTSQKTASLKRIE
jgi:hypothetical protein